MDDMGNGDRTGDGRSLSMSVLSCCELESQSEEVFGENVRDICVCFKSGIS
jgi:hypothetical protein